MPVSDVFSEVHGGDEQRRSDSSLSVLLQEPLCHRIGDAGDSEGRTGGSVEGWWGGSPLRSCSAATILFASPDSPLRGFIRRGSVLSWLGILSVRSAAAAAGVVHSLLISASDVYSAKTRS